MLKRLKIRVGVSVFPRHGKRLPNPARNGELLTNLFMEVGFYQIIEIANFSGENQNKQILSYQEDT